MEKPPESPGCDKVLDKVCDMSTTTSPTDSSAARLVSLLLICFIASIQLSWITLINAGGFHVNPAHLSFLVLTTVFCFWRLPDFWNHSGNGRFITFSLLYMLYLGAIVLSMVIGQSSVHSSTLLLRYFAYFTMFVGCSIILGSEFFSDRLLAKSVYWGCLLGILLFLLFAIYFFVRAGRNFPLELLTAILNGDTQSLRFRIFLPLLNYSSVEIDRSSDNFVAISRMNTVACGLVLAIQLVWMYRQPARAAFSRWFATCALWGVSGGSMVLILGSTSRTNTAAILIAMVVAIFARFANSPTRTERGSIAVVSAFTVTAALLALIAAAPFIGLDDMLNQRFGADVLSRDSRIAQYREAWDLVMRRPFVGYGLGEGVDLINVGGGTGQQVHNLFLAAWFEMGIAGLITAVVFYGYIIVVWVCQFRECRRRFMADTQFLPSMNWCLALAVLPCVRSIFSGQGGNFSMTEWICLAFFFAGYLRLRRSQYEAASQRVCSGKPPVE